MIDVRGLTKVIDTGAHRVEILRGIDLHVPKGQFLAILEHREVGKVHCSVCSRDSTTQPLAKSGSTAKNIAGLPEDSLALVRGRKLGFVFQNYQLIPP